MVPAGTNPQRYCEVGRGEHRCAKP